MFKRKTKVVLVQLGSPESLTWWGLLKYLKEFLSDQRVIDISPWIWKPILYLFVLPLRPFKSLKAYKRLYQDGFPLVVLTEKVKQGLRKRLPSYEVDAAYLLNEPRVKTLFLEWSKENPESRADHVLVLPQFPQYAEATVAAGLDRITSALKDLVNIPHLSIPTSYAQAKCFIDQSVKQIKKYYQGEHLLLSFHGIPLRRVKEKGDLYYEECLKTFHLIQNFLPEIPMTLCFQSRFGSEIWLQPYTAELAVKMAKEGMKKFSIYSPSFVVDCLETTDELGHELVEEVHEKGGELFFIPSLNDQEEWLDDYSLFIKTMVEGSLEEQRDLFYS